MRACVVVRLASLFCAVPMSACFGPGYPEGLVCSEADTCPPGQTCGTDGRCHIGEGADPDGAPPDAAPPDAAPPDAAIDAAVEPDASLDAGAVCPPCDENATCDEETSQCVCGPGWEGDGLECTDIDECSGKSPRHDCDPHATCANAPPGSYTCTCIADYFGDGRSCRPAVSCSELLSLDPTAATGQHVIDPDGPGSIEPYVVHCDMDLEGGGWTLVLVASDDGQNTWTMESRARMTTERAPIGSLDALDRDFKSLAYHDVRFQDLLFVHAPSGITAVYGAVDGAGRDFGSFLSTIGYPICNLSLADQGRPQTGGSLVRQGRLCDTDLYFNLGDHEIANRETGDVTSCLDPASGSNQDTFGPVWSMSNNAACPFDDPAYTSLGPVDQCAACRTDSRTIEATELETGAGVGFGYAIGANTGVPRTGQNNMRMYVRGGVDTPTVAAEAVGVDSAGTRK